MNADRCWWPSFCMFLNRHVGSIGACPVSMVTMNRKTTTDERVPRSAYWRLRMIGVYRRGSAVSCLSAFVALACVGAQAADWQPAKPLEIVVGTPPGGPADDTSRLIGTP